MLSATRRGRRLIQGKLNVPSKQLAVREGGQAPPYGRNRWQFRTQNGQSGRVAAAMSKALKK